MKGEGNSPGTVAQSLSGSPQGLQAAEQPGLTLTADSPNHHLPHLLGHHASQGSWPLLWGLIVVRVIWGEKWVGGDLEARSLASPPGTLGPASRRPSSAGDSHPQLAWLPKEGTGDRKCYLYSRDLTGRR